MFTGLIEAVGRVRTTEPTAGGRRVVLETPLAAELARGESLACSGVCLTVVQADATAATFDVSPVTLGVTAIGLWTPGTAVNLERALRFGDRLGGHVVQGHVDATGTIVGVTAEAQFRRVTVAFPRNYAPLLILRGSVAVDGISLTVAELGEETFGVQIVPHTWGATNLSAATTGRAVNLEFDMVAKYVLRSTDLGGGFGSTPPVRQDGG